MKYKMYFKSFGRQKFTHKLDIESEGKKEKASQGKQCRWTENILLPKC